jgi:hypothetical protein
MTFSIVIEACNKDSFLEGLRAFLIKAQRACDDKLIESNPLSNEQLRDGIRHSIDVQLMAALV